MFLEFDIVEFTDSDVPFTSIIINTAFVGQIQPIDNNMQSNYMKHRAELIEKKANETPSFDEPEIIVPPVEQLPGGGAAIIMMVPMGRTYYTVSAYAEVREQILGVGYKAPPAGAE